MLNDPENFFCPYCGSENFLSLDPTGGSRQRMVLDCEICCRPIVVDLRLSGGTIRELNVTKENE